MRKYPNRAVRKQGRRKRTQGQGKDNYLSQEEESAVLRYLGQVELQFREAIPLARAEARWQSFSCELSVTFYNLSIFWQ